MSSQSSQLSQQSDSSSESLLQTVSTIVERLNSNSDVDEGLELSLASSIAALESLKSLKKLDKKIKREARQFIAQAYKRGNAAVRKVVGYARQQLGYNMLPSELGLQRTFETPPKRVQDTPRTIQQAPAVNRTELGQMTNLMMSLGMGDSPTNPEETDLVHNDALWMKEMMTMLMKCLRRQMVLEQRQTGAGLNPWHAQQNTSEEALVSSISKPMHRTETSHQNEEIDNDPFQQDIDETDANEQADQTAMQPETRCRIFATLTNDVAIKMTDKIHERRHITDSRNKGQENSVKQSNASKNPSPTIQDQEDASRKRQMGTGEACSKKPPMMTRAQIYAELPGSQTSRINPNKGKFFFGSDVRIYGGTRWSELRKRAQNAYVEEIEVTASNDFELEEDNEREPKRARSCKASTLEEGHNTQAENDFETSVTMDENKTYQLSEVSVYKGNWKASEPAFIVITNALFTLDD